MLDNTNVLNPRDAFFGGRTGNTVLYYEAKENEKIRYVDVCSLYPFVNKTSKYPIGHPDIYVSDECVSEGLMTKNPAGDFNMSQAEGLLKSTVLPPRNLILCVLPHRMHGKLMFPLCQQCCAEGKQTDCPHKGVRDRLLHGTWVTDELKKAVDMGYKIVDVAELWQYQTVQHDSATGQKALFEEIVNACIKRKQEASGWPARCTDEASKRAYSAQFKAREGIELDYKKINLNPGARAIWKSWVNSLWGKFGQRDNMGKTELINSYE